MLIVIQKKNKWKVIKVGRERVTLHVTVNFINEFFSSKTEAYPFLIMGLKKIFVNKGRRESVSLDVRRKLTVLTVMYWKLGGKNVQKRVMLDADELVRQNIRNIVLWLVVISNHGRLNIVWII